MTLAKTISSEQARRFYERLGARHDLGARFERRAKARALEHLELRPGLHVLNVGVGTGKEQAIIQARILPGGVATGIDLARTMLQLTRQRTPAPGRSSLCRGDARTLPFRAAAFDRVFSSYMLDLIPASDIPTVLAEMWRVLRPGGRLVLAGLTEGVTLPSRALMAAWKTLHRASPYTLGGCRPLRLTHPLLKAGFHEVKREVIVQGGMPTEVLHASK